MLGGKSPTKPSNPAKSSNGAPENTPMSEAVKRLSEILMSPEQLERVEVLRNTTEEKLNSVEAQLIANMQLQLEQAKQGKQQLLECSDNFLKLHKAFSEIGGMCKTSRDQLPQYELLKKLTIIRQNLSVCINKSKNLVQLDEKLAEIKDLLKDDRKIYEIHKDLADLKELRREAILQKKDMNVPEGEAMIDLTVKFKDLDDLSCTFEKMLFKIVEDALDMSVHRPATLVKAFLVIEREEKADKIRMDSNKRLQATKKRNIESQLQPLSNYRKTAFEHIRTWILQHFEYAFADLESDLEISIDKNLENEEDSIGIALETSIEDITERYLKEADQMLADLKKVENNLAKCVPKSYNIFAFFVEEYHKHFHTIFLRFANQASILSAKDTLALVAWVKSVYEAFLAKAGFSNIEPSLIDPLEELIRGFRVHCQKLMDGWILRAIEVDQKTAPEIINGLFYTDAPITVFRIVTKQMDVVTSTGYDNLTFEVILECIQSVKTFQNQLLSIFKNSWQKLFFEYIIALVNNTKKAVHSLAAFETKVRGTLDTFLFSQLNFENVRQGFFKVAEGAVYVLAQAICRDLDEVLALTGSREWVETEDPYMDAVFDTIHDYYNADVKAVLDPDYHNSLLRDSICCVIENYVASLLKASSNKCTIDSRFFNRLVLEKEIILDYAKDNSVDEKFISHQLSMIDAAIDIYSKSTPEGIINAISVLRSELFEINYVMIKSIVQRRQDLDQTQKTYLRASCKALFNRLK